MSARLSFGTCTFLLWVTALGFATSAHAQTGVSDDRVSLPEGPGSLEGIGENVEPDPNMGSMNYGVPLRLVPGFEGMTPALRLAYNNGAGTSVVGMGWDLMVPSIERMTSKGLPRYDRTDRFAADGGSELVRINPGGGATPVYRSRYEGSFVRYRWEEAGGGSEGHWVAEYTDGRVGYYGADASGQPVPEARVTGPDGTFRYHLVEVRDLYGHKLRYNYIKSGDYSLLESAEYVFDDDDVPYQRVLLAYEDRSGDGSEDFYSDATPGFELLLTKRLSAVAHYSGDVRVRRYALAYVPYGDSGGYTLLSDVTMFGADTEQGPGEAYPIHFSFTYSGSSTDLCTTPGCDEPYSVRMGSIEPGVRTGDATLINIDGDALPDVVNTLGDGKHRFFYNSFEGREAHTFTSGVESDIGFGTDHGLAAGNVQVLDVDGDGIADLLNTRSGVVLENKGGGDWARDYLLFTGSDLPDLGTDLDPDDGDLETVRFLDYDNDKRIDVIKSEGGEGTNATYIYRNTGAGFVLATDTDDIGAGFESDQLQLADMNGDGLLDPVQLMSDGALRYKLNYGWGRWADDWTLISGLPYDTNEARFAEIEDLNNDGVHDLVVVLGNQVRYALNRNGDAFSDPVTLRTGEVTGGIPDRDESTTVLYADMNASGSTDIVWIKDNGEVTYLELFPVQPNLLSRIENNIGHVTEITYGTSAQHMARSPGRWQNPLPHPVIVVDRIDTWDTFSDNHQITDYTYEEGYYDGAEKQFRGFERVSVRTHGDEEHLEGRAVERYDVGRVDRYRKGLKLSAETFSADDPLTHTEMTYADCPLEDVAGPIPDDLEPPVRFVCQLKEETVIKEGASASRWVTTEKEMVYDGFGNVILEADLGVVEMDGGRGCAPCEDEAAFGAPCGAECRGDELYTRTDYVDPAGAGERWILNKPYRTVVAGVEPDDTALFTESRIYYDGPAFEGATLGTLTRGSVTRVEERVDAERFINTSRFRTDAHGNIVEALDPLGEEGGSAHRRVYTISASGLDVEAVDVYIDHPEAGAYVMRQSYTYEPLFGNLTEVSAFTLLSAQGEALGDPRPTRYAYDDFGRIVARALPGDTLEAPTEAYEYQLADPLSAVIIRRRSEAGEPPDLLSMACMDGRGRTTQSREKIAEGRFLVSDFTTFDARSEPVRTYQPFVSTNPSCDVAPPPGVRYSTTRRDGQGRVIEVIAPDADQFGAPSRTRTVYAPLETSSFDPEDSDPGGPHFDTPAVSLENGLGHVYRVERTLGAGGREAQTTLAYNGIGQLVEIVDAGGNVRRQSFDRLSRLLALDDPNTGETERFFFDDAGNTVRHIDPRGVENVAEYDGVNRLVRKWDAAAPEDTAITWTYDVAPEGCPHERCPHPEGMLSAITYPGVSGRSQNRELFGYDARGRTIFSRRHIEGHDFDFGYTYDNANREVASTWPSGQPLRFAYDLASRVVEIEGFVQEVDYSDRGLLESTEMADGSTRELSYDARMRLQTLNVLDQDGVSLQGRGYQLDRLGTIEHIDDLSAPAMSGRPRARLDARFVYDAWYRVRTAEWASPGRTERVEHRYDDLDNVTVVTSNLPGSGANLGELRYEGGAPNAVSHVGDVARAYDEGGYTVARGPMTLRWDHLGRLVGAAVGDDEVAAYGYAAETMRLYKREGDARVFYPHADFVVRDGITSHYVRLGEQQVARVDTIDSAPLFYDDLRADGVINAADAWLIAQEDDRGQAGGALWSSVRRALVEDGPPGGVTFLHADHLGTATLATMKSPGGGVAPRGTRVYYPSGAVRSGGGFVDHFGYTGHEQDRATGLIYAGARYYDPAAARWISRDPMFGALTEESAALFGEATGGYVYTSNRFVTSNDKHGYLTNDVIALSPRPPMAPVQASVTTFEEYENNPDAALGYKGFARPTRAPTRANTIPTVTTTNLGGGQEVSSTWMRSGEVMEPAAFVSMLKKSGLAPGDYGSSLQLHVRGCNSGATTRGDFGGGVTSLPPYAGRLADALRSAGYSGIDVVGYKGSTRGKSAQYVLKGVGGKQLKNLSKPSGWVPGQGAASADKRHTRYAISTLDRAQVRSKQKASISTFGRSSSSVVTKAWGHGWVPIIKPKR